MKAILFIASLLLLSGPAAATWYLDDPQCDPAPVRPSCMSEIETFENKIRYQNCEEFVGIYEKEMQRHLDCVDRALTAQRLHFEDDQIDWICRSEKYGHAVEGKACGGQ